MSRFALTSRGVMPVSPSRRLDGRDVSLSVRSRQASIIDSSFSVFFETIRVSGVPRAMRVAPSFASCAGSGRPSKARTTLGAWMRTVVVQPLDSRATTMAMRSTAMVAKNNKSIRCAGAAQRAKASATPCTRPVSPAS